MWHWAGFLTSLTPSLFTCKTRIIIKVTGVSWGLNNTHKESIHNKSLGTLSYFSISDHYAMDFWIWSSTKFSPYSKREKKKSYLSNCLYEKSKYINRILPNKSTSVKFIFLNVGVIMMVTAQIKLFHQDTQQLVLQGIYICSIIWGKYAVGFHEERVMFDLWHSHKCEQFGSGWSKEMYSSISPPSWTHPDPLWGLLVHSRQWQGWGGGGRGRTRGKGIALMGFPLYDLHLFCYMETGLLKQFEQI